jgi:hypothetical protein
MSVINARVQAVGVLSNFGLVLNVMTALLMTFAVTLVLMHLAAPLAAPATDLDFLAMAYG